MYFYNKHKISKNDIINVVKSLKSKNITKGNYLSNFEKKLKIYFGSKYSLAFSNGTSALFAIARSLEWNSDNNILLSPMTFVAGANAVSSVNANLFFVDIDKNGNLDPLKAEKKIIELKKKNKKISAIIVTDYGGNPADWKKFFELKKKYKFILINDNCHSLGSKLDGDSKYAIKYADLVVQSFHAVKNITTAEGGAILTNSQKIYIKLKSTREHGFFQKKKNFLPWSYNLNKYGYNFRLSDLNCALGVSQFQNLEKFIKKRNKLAKIYNSIFRDNDKLIIPKILQNNFCSYHLYPLRFKWNKIKITKRNFYETLKNKYGISLQIHYKPTYKFNLYKKFVKNARKEFPNTENFYNEVFSIPLYVDLKYKDLKYIGKSINTLIKN